MLNIEWLQRWLPVIIQRCYVVVDRWIEKPCLWVAGERTWDLMYCRSRYRNLGYAHQPPLQRTTAAPRKNKILYGWPRRAPDVMRPLKNLHSALFSRFLTHTNLTKIYVHSSWLIKSLRDGKVCILAQAKHGSGPHRGTHTPLLEASKMDWHWHWYDVTRRLLTS